MMCLKRAKKDIAKLPSGFCIAYTVKKSMVIYAKVCLSLFSTHGIIAFTRACDKGRCVDLIVHVIILNVLFIVLLFC